MKKSTNPIIVPLILFLVSALLLGTATYAWLRVNAGARNMKFQMARINSEVWVYSGVDSNKNGIPDLNDAPYTSVSNTDANEITTTYDLYYTENYSFDFIGREYALAAYSGSTTITATAENLFPSQLQTYKFIAVNKSTLENKMAIALEDRNNTVGAVYNSTAGENPYLLAMLYVRVGLINSDGSLSFGEFKYLSDMIKSIEKNADDTYKYTLTGLTLSEGYSIDAMAGEEEGRADFWLQVGIAPYVSLAEQESFADLGITEADYQSMQGKSIQLPPLYMHFDLEVNE